MKKKLLILSLAIAAISCDNAKDDIRPVIDVTYVTGANLPFIINPAQFTENSTSGSIVTYASQGVSEELLDKRFIRYTPSPNFQEGEDQFTMTVEGPNQGPVDVRVTTEVNDNSCDYGPVFDFIQVKKGETVTIDLLANDFFCGQEYPGSGGISNYELKSDFDNSDFVEFHIGGGGSSRANMIIRAPETTGTVTFIYEVGLGIIDDSVPNSPVGLNPSRYDVYLIAQATIEIVD